MIVDDMLEDSPVFRLELDKHGETILPKEIGPGLETSVCEGIHTFLNIYMDFKYRFAYCFPGAVRIHKSVYFVIRFYLGHP